MVTHDQLGWLSDAVACANDEGQCGPEHFEALRTLAVACGLDTREKFQAVIDDFSKRTDVFRLSLRFGEEVFRERQ